MPEYLELHLPYYLTATGRRNRTAPHAVIQLAIPRIPQLRARYHHDLLHKLWHEGHGPFTPADIFTLYPFQAIRRDIYEGIKNHEAHQLGLLQGGNITQPHTPGKTPQAIETRGALRALTYEQAYRDIEAYLGLPVDEAVTRTRQHRIHWASEPITISEAEYWLRHDAVHTEFSDEYDIRLEDLAELRKEQTRREQLKANT